jgi:gliding motility-associated-like protein
MSWRPCYIVIGLWCLSFCASAQYMSRLGRFQVDAKKGCAPLTVNITINAPFSCTDGTSCAVDYEGNGTTEPFNTPPFTHTYTQPGTYTLRILIGSVGDFDDIQIVVAPNTPPQFEVFSCGGNQVSVHLIDTNYDQYFINYGDGPEVGPFSSQAKNTHGYLSTGVKTVTVRGRHLINGLPATENCTPGSRNITAMATLPLASITQLQVVDATSVQLNFNMPPDVQYRLEIATNSSTNFQLYKIVYNVTTEMVTNLKTDDNYYCFRLGVFDPCFNNTSVYSPVICSTNLDVAVQNNFNNVTWATSPAGVSNFRMTRTSQANTLTTTVTTSPYNDTDIICGTQYCYVLVANYPNGSTSTSLEKCGIAISTDTPPPIDNISAIVDEPALSLQWLQPSTAVAAEYSVFKSVNGAYSLFGKTAMRQLVDNQYATQTQSCYRISYTDACNNQSALGLEACPVRLSANLQNDNTITLTWTAYTGWKGGVSSYTVEKYSEQGQLIQTFPAGNALSFYDDVNDINHQTYLYVVRANPVDGNLVQSVSNRVSVIKDPNLFYPTAFTPNNDQLNDIFNVYGQYIVSFEMNIFNRWGELMYTTTDLQQGWDGNFRGNPMPEGTYTFIANITDRAGRALKKSGSVLLLRKDQ